MSLKLSGTGLAGFKRLNQVLNSQRKRGKGVLSEGNDLNLKFSEKIVG